jgi:acetyl-CoA/propionyl-CoA carboxylase, biotin carboxylase, biotin carboxyl carrier protein
VESKELAERADQLSHRTTTIPAAPDGAVPAARAHQRIVHAEVDGRRFEVRVLTPEPPHADLARRRRERATRQLHHATARDAIVSPMQGTVLAVEVGEGEAVEAGHVICVVEAMKMENEITAPRSGVVSDLSVAPGEPIATGQVICVVTQEADDGA